MRASLHVFTHAEDDRKKSPSRLCRQAAGSRRSPELRGGGAPVARAGLAGLEAGNSPDEGAWRSISADCWPGPMTMDILEEHMRMTRCNSAFERVMRGHWRSSPVIAAGIAFFTLASSAIAQESRAEIIRPGTGGQEPAAPAAAGERRRACPRPARRLGIHRGRAARRLSMGRARSIRAEASPAARGSASHLETTAP